MVHSIALDRRRILPVSSVIQGTYGIRDVALSVPTVVGRSGVEAQLEIDLWPKEVAAIRRSGEVLRETIDEVLKRNPNAAKVAPIAKKTIPAGNDNAKKSTLGSWNGNGSSRVTISGQTNGGRRA